MLYYFLKIGVEGASQFFFIKSRHMIHHVLALFALIPNLLSVLKSDLLIKSYRPYKFKTNRSPSSQRNALRGPGFWLPPQKDMC